MIPTTIAIGEDVSSSLIEETEQPTYTYKMDLETRVQGKTDNLEAMEQVIFKILQTERYQHSKVYTDNYGVEFIDLYGQPIAYVIPEIERRITEALTWDERITDVTDFNFIGAKNKVLVTFKAHTKFGIVKSQTEVNF